MELESVRKLAARMQEDSEELERERQQASGRCPGETSHYGESGESVAHVPRRLGGGSC